MNGNWENREEKMKNMLKNPELDDKWAPSQSEALKNSMLSILKFTVIFAVGFAVTYFVWTTDFDVLSIKGKMAVEFRCSLRTLCGVGCIIWWITLLITSLLISLVLAGIFLEDSGPGTGFSIIGILKKIGQAFMVFCMVVSVYKLIGIIGDIIIFINNTIPVGTEYAIKTPVIHKHKYNGRSSGYELHYNIEGLKTIHDVGEKCYDYYNVGDTVAVRVSKGCLGIPMVHMLWDPHSTDRDELGYAIEQADDTGGNEPMTESDMVDKQLNTPLPDYMENLLPHVAGCTGWVTVAFDVAADRTISNVRISESLGKRVDNAVMKGVRDMGTWLGIGTGCHVRLSVAYGGGSASYMSVKEKRNASGDSQEAEESEYGYYFNKGDNKNKSVIVK